MINRKNNRFGLISLMATVSVVCWHCYCGSRIERYAIPLLFTWSVPWFFFISGVFLARSYENRGAIDLLRSKIWSLVVPYAIWCVWGLLIVGFYNCGSFCEAFGLTVSRIHPSSNGALWYLRALIIFVVVAVPLLSIRMPQRGCVICRGGGGSVLFIAIIMLINKYLFAISTGSAPVYFAMGMLFSQYILGVQENSVKYAKLLSCVGVILFIVGKIVYFTKGYDFFVQGGALWANLSYVGLILFFLFGLDKVFGLALCSKLLVRSAGMTSVVYFLHYPVLRRVIDFHFASDSINHDLLFTSLILVAPSFFFFIVYLLQRTFPRVCNLISGGR